MQGCSRAAAVAAALLCAVPATASARSELRGETGQQRPVVLGLDDSGRIDRAEVGWVARCRRSRATVDTTTGIPLEIYEASRDLVATTTRIGVRQRKLRMAVTLRLRGTRELASRRWAGSFSIDVVVRRGRRVLDRCATGLLSWSVPLGSAAAREPSLASTPSDPPTYTSPSSSSSSSPPPEDPPPPSSPPSNTPGSFDESPEPRSWTLRIDSELGDPIGDGGRYDLSQRNSEMTGLIARDDIVSFTLRDGNGDFWSGWFRPPRGQPIGEGEYTDDRGEDDDREPQLSISGRGTGCNDSSGTFTVTDLQEDGTRTLTRFVVEFEHVCDGNLTGLTGLFVVETDRY